MITQSKEPLFANFHSFMIDFRKQGINPLSLFVYFNRFCTTSPIYPLSVDDIEIYNRRVIDEHEDLNHNQFWNYCQNQKEQEWYHYKTRMSSLAKQIESLQAQVASDDYFLSSMEAPVDYRGRI